MAALVEEHVTLGSTPDPVSPSGHESVAGAVGYATRQHWRGETGQDESEDVGGCGDLVQREVPSFTQRGCSKQSGWSDFVSTALYNYYGMVRNQILHTNIANGLTT